MWPDVRLALRQIKRRPGYAFACIAVLAFGLGACTAVFSALYSAVLKPLPYPDASRLVILRNRSLHSPAQGFGASPFDYFTLSRHRELFESAGAFYFLDLSRSGVDIPKKVNAVAISSTLFEVLGTQPLIGRDFSSLEHRPAGPHAVILSESYWESAFRRDPEILNKSLRLNGELFPVIGVMPKAFAFPNEVTEMWVPMVLRDENDSRNFYLRMYARLAPGLSFDRASAELDELSRQFAQENSARKEWTYFLIPMLRNNDPSARQWLWILFGAVGCFLLIVCSNVAGLVLARSSERRFDLAVRRALGASRWRIVRQVLTEVLVLAGLGGIAALGIAWAGVVLLARFGPGIPSQMETPVFFFCAALSIVTGLGCGIYPALFSGAITESRRQHTASRASRRWQQGLMVVQVGIATALLVCGGLLIHSLVILLQSPLGFDPRNVLTMTISLPVARYSTAESRGRFYDAVLNQIAAIPGVERAAACTLLPFGYGENVNTFEISGQPKPAAAQFADLSSVSAGYFETMRIPRLRGRFFEANDGIGTVPLVVINETFAQRYFGAEDPLGRQIKMAWGRAYTVVGVAGSVKISAVDLESPPMLYFASSQFPVTDMTLTIRGNLSQSDLVRDVERIVAGIDRDQPVYDVAPLQKRIDHSLQSRRFVVLLMAVFAAAGTVLAALGLYGLLSYIVTLQRREIGIRMALGANRATIAILICRGAMMLLVGGVVLGSATAIAARRLIASQAYGVTVGDPVTWIAVLGVICASGALASALPAWRAARVSPAEALRSE